MIDGNSILLLLIVSFLVGFITNLLSQSIRKIISILTTVPLLIFFLTAINSGMEINNTTELSSWITIFITNSIPLVLAYVATAVGAGIVTGSRRRQ